MAEKFNALILYALIQYLDDKGILDGPEFRGHCLKFLKYTTLAEAEEEEFRKMILRMPGIGLVG